MVDYPNCLEISVRQMTVSATVSIRAHKADTSRLIGSEGVNFRAISAVLIAVGGRMGLRVTIPPIQDPVFGEPEKSIFRQKKDWPRKEIMSLLVDTVKAIVRNKEAVKLNEDHADPQLSTVEVEVSSSERPDLLQQVNPSIERLFDAIGRTNGRILAVTLVQSPGGEAEDTASQPQRSDGRFTREI